MTLTAGDRLGPYTVADKIGAGGMGEVYRARDTKLDRDVALKVLPEAFTSDPDRLARFEREAKLLASLNHPNIGSIYGFEEAEPSSPQDVAQGFSPAVRALVLELIEGPTLADRIAEGPLPINEVLPIAQQIAEALEAAHEQGVIHRDLKPANIKLRPDGTVKVLDFGLAKAFQPEASGASAGMSPTISLTAAATQMGMVIGTAAYMAPEQAKGKAVDKRADVWAFGCVLFEMLTGRRVFDATDVSEVLALVLVKDADLTSLPTDVPPGVRVLLGRCLVKEPRDRLRDIGEARLTLRETGTAPAALAPSSVSVPTPAAPVVPAGPLRLWQRPVPALLAAILVAAISGLAVWGGTRSEGPAPSPVRFRLAAPSPPGLNLAPQSGDVAVSPDGHRIAYLTGNGVDVNEPKQLLLRSLSDFTPTTLAEEPGLHSPFFSPDGEWVGYYDLADLELRRVSIRGGSAIPVCDLPAFMRGASWGADDTIIFATAEAESGLWRVAASGGVPEPLTTPDAAAGEQNHFWPQILPGGEAVLFTVMAFPIEDSHIAALSLSTGEQEVVLRGGSYARYSPTGHLVYAAGDGLRAVRFDAERLEASGSPVSVVDGVSTKASGAASFSLSDNGTLAYVPDAVGTMAARTLVWVDREGREVALAAPPAPYESPRISPDGLYVAVEERRPANSDVMVYDLERETPTRLTFDPANDGWPIWSPDGQRVAFASFRAGAANIFSKSADGTGQTEQLTTTDNGLVPESWSADGQTLVAMNAAGVRGADLQSVSLGTENRVDSLIGGDGSQVYADLSPDGRWVAYISDASGQFEVYVRPFPNVDDGFWQVSRDGGQDPVWARSGRELFFRGLAGEMRVVSVEMDPSFTFGNPEVLFQAPYRLGAAGRARPWDVAPDGDRFLMIKDASSGDGAAAEPHIVVVQHWIEELKERVPVD